ncbi:MAG: hypothetical protein FWC75_03030 [Oscillospiraceae bacterium]|nr:hypothetical protein [Oscillospiraceae bacterium]
MYADLNDWVEVIGKFGFIERDGVRLMGIHLDALNVLEVRGNEFIRS